MADFKRLVFLMILTFQWILSKGDTEVTCVYSESCVLPCGFKRGSDVRILWIKVTTGDTWVHSYYSGQDELEYQDQNFKGRTSLFKDQISNGNASLLLTGVKFQDQGSYECNVVTERRIQESYINLKIEAPVRRIDIFQEENSITCRSEGIYPEPELTWSTIPPTHRTLQPQTKVHQTAEQLYSISSSLMVSDHDAGLIYSCTIRNRRSSMTATLTQQGFLSYHKVFMGLFISCLIVAPSGTAATLYLMIKFLYDVIKNGDSLKPEVCKRLTIISLIAAAAVVSAVLYVSLSAAGIFSDSEVLLVLSIIILIVTASSLVLCWIICGLSRNKDDSLKSQVFKGLKIIFLITAASGAATTLTVSVTIGDILGGKEYFEGLLISNWIAALSGVAVLIITYMDMMKSIKENGHLVRKGTRYVFRLHDVLIVAASSTAAVALIIISIVYSFIAKKGISRGLTGLIGLLISSVILALLGAAVLMMICWRLNKGIKENEQPEGTGTLSIKIVFSLKDIVIVGGLFFVVMVSYMIGMLYLGVTQKHSSLHGGLRELLINFLIVSVPGIIILHGMLMNRRDCGRFLGKCKISFPFYQTV